MLIENICQILWYLFSIILVKLMMPKLYHEKALQINPNLADILEVKELADLIN